MSVETVAGFPIYRRSAGTGSQRALMIHCSLAHCGAWRGIEAHLAPLLRMDSFDLPGHGKSGDWTGAGDYQDALVSIAGAMIGARAHLIGHSFGATAALRLAALMPDKVESLVLIEPVLFSAARESGAHARHMEEIAPFADFLAKGDREGAARFFNRFWGTGQGWDSLPDPTRQAMAERIHLIMEGAPVTDADIHGQTAPGALEGIRQPVLLIEGANSPAIVAAVHDVLEARLPNVRRVVVERAGHMVPITHPERAAREVADFLGF